MRWVGRPGMSADEILVTEGLCKSFGDFSAVSDVSLSIRRGSIHALIGPNGAGQDDLLQYADQIHRAECRADHLQRPRHHGRAAGRRREARPRPLVPDLGGVSASERARERPHRAAAEARRLVRLLAFEIGARAAERPGARTARQRWADPVRLCEGGGDLLRSQAGARTRHHARGRTGAHAARRADGRHGPRGYRSHRRSHPPRLGQPHDSDGRAQSSGRRQSVGPHHRADPGTRARRGRLSRRV